MYNYIFLCTHFLCNTTKLPLQNEQALVKMDFPLPISCNLCIDEALDVEFGFVCSQNVPCPFIVHFYASK